MTKAGTIIGLADWLETPVGQYLREWEQQQVEILVADVFGFHAVQLGLPKLDGLHANRMPHRWYAIDPGREDARGATPRRASQSPHEAVRTNASGVAPRTATFDLQCEFDALPFQSRSLDLVLLPHALELARDPHLALSEVERVLVPEGKVIIIGFNPASLWGLRHRGSRLLSRLGARFSEVPFLPTEGEFIAYGRLRDWLRLLSFEVETGQFGCYRPALRSEKWLSRYGWMDRLGHRWWPVFGAVYLLVAVKRVRGMRLIGLARAAQNSQPKAAPAVSVHQRGDGPPRIDL